MFAITQDHFLLKPGYLLALVILALCLLYVSEIAAEPGYRLSPGTHKRLTKVHEQLDLENYDAATRELNALLDRVSDRSYEKAVVLQTLGHAEAMRERYPAALKVYEASLALDALPEDAEQQIRYKLAQLYLATGVPEKAVSALQKWLQRTSEPPAQAWFMLGGAYMQLSRYHMAVEPLEKAVAGADAPEETWYQTLLAAHYELKSYKRCASLLEKMVRLFPDEQYWRQLAGIYLTLNRYDQALVTLELGDRQNMLKTEQDVLQLVQLYLYQDIPYKAAELLQSRMSRGQIERSIRNRELLASAWSQARERELAIRAYESLAKNSDKAEAGLHLAQLYIENERWNDAAVALEVALTKADLTKPGDAWLLLGIARFELEEYPASREAFEKAAGYESSRESGGQWLEHLEEHAHQDASG